MARIEKHGYGRRFQGRNMVPIARSEGPKASRHAQSGSTESRQHAAAAFQHRRVGPQHSVDGQCQQNVPRKDGMPRRTRTKPAWRSVPFHTRPKSIESEHDVWSFLQRVVRHLDSLEQRKWPGRDLRTRFREHRKQQTPASDKFAWRLWLESYAR